MAPTMDYSHRPPLDPSDLGPRRSVTGKASAVSEYAQVFNGFEVPICYSL